MAGMRSAVRAVLICGAAASAVLACTGGADPGSESVAEDADAEAPRVPNPPPRYARVAVGDAAAADPDGATKLQMKCGGLTPYVCLFEDGTFVCSGTPCLPDCRRIGCLGGERCTSCSDGYRCVAEGDGC